MHPLNTLSDILLTPSGTIIDFTPLHLINAPVPISIIPLFKVTSVNPVQSQKAKFLIVFTFSGILIFFNPLHSSKALDPIFCNVFENTTSVNPVYPLKISSFKDITFFPSIVAGISTFPVTVVVLQSRFIILSELSTSYCHSIPCCSSFQVFVSAFTIDGNKTINNAITIAVIS